MMELEPLEKCSLLEVDQFMLMVCSMQDTGSTLLILKPTSWVVDPFTMLLSVMQAVVESSEVCIPALKLGLLVMLLYVLGIIFGPIRISLNHSSSTSKILRILFFLTCNFGKFLKIFEKKFLILILKDYLITFQWNMISYILLL